MPNSKTDIKPNQRVVKEKIRLTLNTGNREKFRKFVNKKITGSEIVPMGCIISRELMNAHYELNATNTINLVLQLHKSGKMTPKELEYNGTRYQLVKK